MSALQKITEAQMDASGVCSAPDVLNGTTVQNKAVFDKMVRQLVAPAYNAAVDAIDAINATETGIEAEEALRVAAEGGRVNAENGRVGAEAGRVSAETARIHAENARSAAESSRVTAESNRVSAENVRAAAETGRANAENSREAQEIARAEAETARADENTGIVAQATAQANAAAESARLAAQVVLGQIQDGSLTEAKLVAEVQAAIERAKAGGAIDLSLSNKATRYRGNARGLGYTKLADIKGDGTYLIVDGPSYLTDYPAFLTARGLNYATLQVFNAIDVYWGKTLYAQNAAQTLSAVAVWCGDAGWIDIATATPPTEYNLPLASGYSTIDGCTYFKTQDNVVAVTGNINHAGGFTRLSQIAELPIDCRPANTKISSYGTYAGGYGGGIIFYPNGVVCLAQDLSVEAIYFTATFAAAN